MEFRLLGPVEALRDGNPVVLGGAKPRALLGLLLLHASEVVSRDRLIDALWGERPPGTAGHSLDVQISRLRKAFEPEEPLLTRPGGYVLQVEPESIDACRFERLLEDGRRANAEGEPARALEALEAALGLWRGAALAELSYETFARTEIERLEELRLVATEERIDAELALGRHDTLVPGLEALTARNPLRERLRGQLMLALYRAGRQAEALRVYADGRRQLVDELGIEPGQALKDLEQRILRQDPALEAPRARAATRPRRAAAGAFALALAGAAVAVIVGLTRGGAESAAALAEPDSNVFLASSTGKVAHEAAVRDTVAVQFGAGSLWSVSSEGTLTRLDPATGEIVASIGLGITRPGGLAFGQGSMWVTDAYSPTLLRVDPAVNEVVDRFPLPTKAVVTTSTGDVAVGAGSVWVGHGGFNPGAWVERLVPATGRVQARFPIPGGDADSVAFGDGAIWVASHASGEVRKIDPRTNRVVLTMTDLPREPCCITAGGGFVWVAVNPDSAVWKVSRAGRPLTDISLPSAIKGLAYADGAVWAAVGEEGTVVRIDPTSNALRSYEVGHRVEDVDAEGGVVGVAVQESTADLTGSLEGDVVRVGVKSESLFEIGGRSTDPARYAPWDKNLLQFHHATCAKLYNYADVEDDEGRTIVPEVAADFPEVSAGGRTHTIRVRPGFGFSPPSGEEVTAESFQHALERVLSPKYNPERFNPAFANLVGAQDYHAGLTHHISGVEADRDTLVIRLLEPDPHLPRALTLHLFCAVPVGTPIVPNGLDTPIPSAGPYYLAAITDSVAVLRPNPKYGGSRSQVLDAIVYELGVAPREAATRIANGTLDYVLERDPALAPGSAAARGAGSRHGLTPDPLAHVEFLAFNTGRPLFADIRMRRAVQYALDRVALAELHPGGGTPSTRLVSSKVPGFVDEQLYPLQPDLRTARKLAGGKKARAVLYAFSDPYIDPLNRALRDQLAAIGISTTFVEMRNEDYASGALAAKAARSDLIGGGMGAETGDPVRYLEQLFLPEQDRRELDRIAGLSSPERETRAAALVRRIERKSLFAVYWHDAIPELVSSRLGCVVHQPMYPGVDLAALCLEDSDG